MCSQFINFPSSLQEESLTFQSQLDVLEAELMRTRQELQELQVMNNDAILSKDTAKVGHPHHLIGLGRVGLSQLR